jgi:hypothetical protein
MKRLQLFEWEDQVWLPAFIRNFITDHLHFFQNLKMRRQVNRAIAELLESALSRTGTEQIVDLCTGAGGPLREIQRILLRDFQLQVKVILTDLYPNVEALKTRESEGRGAVIVRYDSISSFEVPPDLQGLRTLFTSFHHFKPDQAQLILSDAALKRQPIAIFEILERTPRMLFKTAILALWQAFMFTPRVGRFTFMRFYITYCLPIAPAIMVWDGLVSVMRSYTQKELLQIAAKISANEYEWEAGKFYCTGRSGLKMPTIYLIGIPTKIAK